VIITPTRTASPESDGTAYIGSFNWAGDHPCWVFVFGVKYCAEACSHEIGHTFGLSITENFRAWAIWNIMGPWSGELGWAPIMGWSLDQPCHNGAEASTGERTIRPTTLRSSGPKNNSVGYRPDDTGDTWRRHVI
jgi:hypothetical protein